MSDAAATRTGRPARARSLACPHCGAPVMVRANGISVTAICGSCGSMLDVANPDVQMLAKAQSRTRQPLIAIGTRGVLEETEWEVIGFQSRSSGGGVWQWDEYLLYNPYRGFRFLAQDHGIWTLNCLLRTSVSEGGQVSGEGRTYRPGEAGLARTEYVLGEFYWRVKAGDIVSVREFTSEPYVLSQERNGTEVTWSRGERQEERAVRDAFKLAPAAEPRRPRSIWSYWAVAAFTLLMLGLMQSVDFGPHVNFLVSRQPMAVRTGEPGRAFASPVFTVPDQGGNLTFVFTAQPTDQWMNLEVSLVAEAGDRRFDETLTIDQGGADPPEYTFPSVPGGQYKIVATILPSALDGMVRETELRTQAFTIDVRRHTPTTEFMWLFGIVILVWPCAVAFRRVM